MLHWGSFTYDVQNLHKEGDSGVAGRVVKLILLTGSDLTPCDENPSYVTVDYHLVSGVFRWFESCPRNFGKTKTLLSKRCHESS